MKKTAVPDAYRRGFASLEKWWQSGDNRSLQTAVGMEKMSRKWLFMASSNIKNMGELIELISNLKTNKRK